MDRHKLSSSKLSLGLVGVAMAGLFTIAVLNAASTIVYAQNSTSSSSPILSKNTVLGAITSIQNDIIGKTNWIVGGAYKMSNINSANPTFNGTFI